MIALRYRFCRSNAPKKGYRSEKAESLNIFLTLPKSYVAAGVPRSSPGELLSCSFLPQHTSIKWTVRCHCRHGWRAMKFCHFIRFFACFFPRGMMVIHSHVFLVFFYFVLLSEQINVRARGIWKLHLRIWAALVKLHNSFPSFLVISLHFLSSTKEAGYHLDLSTKATSCVWHQRLWNW